MDECFRTTIMIIIIIIGSFQMRVSCGLANLITSGALPTDISENEIPHDALIMYNPCHDGGEVFFDGFGG